jgi:hypothetical protein
MGSVPNLRHEAPDAVQRRRIFDHLLTQLEDWYADSVRARAYDGGGGSGTREAGHAILLRNRYPGPDWRRLWREAEGDPARQGTLLDAVKDELHGLSHGPSQSSPASGLHAGTQEWRQAVAAADGSLRAVARRFGISHTEVRRIRLQEGV